MNRHDLHHYRQDWWGEKLVGFLARNDASMIALAIFAVFILANMNWDVVFGYRPH